MMLSKIHEKIPIKDLCRLLKYDPHTGDFYWIERPVDMFVNAGDCKRWNNRHATKKAGNLDFKGNLRIRIGENLYYGHRLAFAIMIGKFPKNEVDHINGKRSDNKWKNLREATRNENCRNTKKPKNNTSGIKGISYRNSSKKWHVYITHNKKKIHLGFFEKKEDAIKARKLAEIKYHGAFAYKEAANE